MIRNLKGILKNRTPPEWKEADEIVKGVWLGTNSENEHAQRRNITQVICISKEPLTDLEREGFKKAPDLDKTVFTLESDTEGDLLPIFGEVCSIIDRTFGNGECVLVWDVGGGVAALAAYLMRTYDVSLPEAMTAITQARLKRAKPTLLPSQRIIDLLHNDIYQKQLDMWQACKYDIHENIITNLSEPPEKWMIKSVGGKSEKKRHDVLPISESIEENLPHTSKQPHRLSTIAEMKEEVRRLSTKRKEENPLGQNPLGQNPLGQNPLGQNPFQHGLWGP